MIESLINTTKIAVLKELTDGDLSSLKESLKTIFQEKLVSGSNIKTINGNNVLGEGNLVVGGNVQANWNETNTTSESYIQNKPNIPTNTSDLINDSNFPVDSEYVHTDNNFTNNEKIKLNNLENYDDTEVKANIQELQNNKEDISNKKSSISNSTVEFPNSKAVYDNLLLKEDKSNKTQTIVNDETKYTSGKAVYIHTSNTSNPHNVNNPQLGNGYGTCDTEELTLSKEATLTDFKLETGGIVGIKFTHSVPANSTLNINNTGAKPIYHNGGLLKSGTILDGNIAFFIYDGSNFNLLSDKLISGTTIKTVQGRSLLGSGNVSILESELVRRSFTVLNETISGSRSGDTIYLIGFYDFTSETDQEYILGVTIDKDLTIVGVDCTIDAHQLARVFNVTNNSNVTFKNITFNNCYNENYGSAINGSNGGTIDLIDCDFLNCHNNAVMGKVNSINCLYSNCTTSSDGGAIILNGNNNSVDNSIFVNCSAGDGGAIMVMGDVAITNSSFEKCTTSNKGGAIYNSSNELYMSNCSFNKCTTSSDGGAIYSVYNINIIDSSFNECTASNNGGAISSIEVNIIKSSFNECTASNNGGAIDVNYETTSSRISNTKFNNNSSKYGGGIYIVGGVTNNYISNCYFVENTASSNDGSDAIFIKDTCNVYNCTFDVYDNDKPNAIWGSVNSSSQKTFNGDIINCGFINRSTSTKPIWLTDGINCYDDKESYLVTNNKIVDLVYPVGSIYMSVNTTEPSTLFGGTWVKMENSFLLGSGNKTLGSTGGSADAVVVSHTHTQNAHNHSTSSGYSYLTSTGNIAVNGTLRALTSSSSSGIHYIYSPDGDGINEVENTANTTATNKSTGVDGTDKNMPPYIVVNMWKRTA